MLFLSINSGSSSIKVNVYDFDPLTSLPSKIPLKTAHTRWNEEFKNVILSYSNSSSAETNIPLKVSSFSEALEKTLSFLEISNRVDIIGHRVVHGGNAFRKTICINEDVEKKIESLIPLAPLHNALNLKGIQIAKSLFPKSKQYAIFDTSFHSTIPNHAKIYPGPYSWYKKDIYKYGFHGISHQYCTERATSLIHDPLKKLKFCICHLGSGSSLCAVLDGKSIDTTMGFTPLEGMMMACRSGSVDLGILFYFLREEKMSPDELEKILNHRSGLLGISGISEDFKEILSAKKNGNVRASLALEIYLYRLNQYIFSMIGCLQGMDALIFTGGIGENSAWLREKVCEKLSFMGIEIDKEINNSLDKTDKELSASFSTSKVLLIHTQEEWEIAKQALLAFKQEIQV